MMKIFFIFKALKAIVCIAEKNLLQIIHFLSMGFSMMTSLTDDIPIKKSNSLYYP